MTAAVFGHSPRGCSSRSGDEGGVNELAKARLGRPRGSGAPGCQNPAPSREGRGQTARTGEASHDLVLAKQAAPTTSLPHSPPAA